MSDDTATWIYNSSRETYNKTLKTLKGKYSKDYKRLRQSREEQKLQNPKDQHSWSKDNLSRWAYDYASPTIQACLKYGASIPIHKFYDFSLSGKNAQHWEQNEELFKKKGLNLLDQNSVVLTYHLKAVNNDETGKLLDHAWAITKGDITAPPQYTLLAVNQANADSSSDPTISSAISEYNKTLNNLNDQLKELHASNQRLRDTSVTDEKIRENSTHVLSSIGVDHPLYGSIAHKINDKSKKFTEKERTAVLSAITKKESDEQKAAREKIEKLKASLASQTVTIKEQGIDKKLANSDALSAPLDDGYLEMSGGGSGKETETSLMVVENGIIVTKKLTYKDPRGNEHPLKLSNEEFETIVNKWNNKNPTNRLKVTETWNGKRSVNFTGAQKNLKGAFVDFMKAEGGKLRNAHVDASTNSATDDLSLSSSSIPSCGPYNPK